MAIKASIETLFGESRELYIRLNNAEVSNHGVASFAKFRGYASKEAFEAGKPYMWERDVEFMADVESSESLWSQAYSSLQQQLQDPQDPLLAKLEGMVESIFETITTVLK